MIAIMSYNSLLYYWLRNLYILSYFNEISKPLTFNQVRFYKNMHKKIPYNLLNYKGLVIGARRFELPTP
jgi:hypothetical protein